MNAVIYARYSSDRQTEQSIEGQMRECQEFAEREGITIINSYIDRAISGKTDNRPAFQQMIADSSSHEFEYVLVYKLDRFARNRYDSAMYKAKLKKNGVKVVSAKENITDSPEGIILEGLLEAMNEYYSAELSQKIKRGMRENKIKGKTTGGNIALGYKIDADKHLIIDEHGANAVRIIFRMYCEGNSLSDICRTLDIKGYKTSRGNKFNVSGVGRIIKNRHYIGEAGFPGDKNCPAIIDEETFARANTKLIEFTSHRKKKRPRAEYLLTTKLYCGECHKRMTGKAGTSNTKNMYYYYSCGTSGHEWLRKDEIENTVLKHTIAFLTPEHILHIAKKAYDIYTASIENDSETVCLENELKSVDTAIANLIKAIEQGIFTASTRKRLEELETRKSELETEISHKKIKAPELKPEHFEVILKKYVNTDINDIRMCKSIIETLIDKVVVYPDKIIVTLNLLNSSNSLETIEAAVDSSSILAFGGGDAMISELSSNIIGFILIR